MKLAELNKRVEAEPSPLLLPPPAPPSVKPARTVKDQRRWDIEQGWGGDHDQEYKYTPQQPGMQESVWLNLLGKVQRGEVENPREPYKGDG